MLNVSRKANEDRTRQILLETAAEVFAERGYRTATVREICQRAGVNIAAVNYYFGDKDQLYAEVLKYSLHCAHEKYPSDYGLAPGANLEERLRAFVHSFLLRIFDQGRHAWHGKLMLREMIEPTRALDDLVEEEIRPMAKDLMALVRELMGPEAAGETVRLCGLSVVSQCLFYHHCQPVHSRLYPKKTFAARDLEQLADHITEFSLAAISALGKQAKPRRRRGTS